MVTGYPSLGFISSVNVGRMGLESDHIDQQLIKVARTCAPFYLLSDPIVTSVLTIN